MREFNGELVLATPPLASAKLVWSRYGGPQGEYPLAVVNNPDGTSTLTTDARLPRGVLKLCVTPTDKDCCPRWLDVWADGCPPTSTIREHSPGSGNDPGPIPSCSIPSCPPPPAP